MFHIIPHRLFLKIIILNYHIYVNMSPSLQRKNEKYKREKYDIVNKRFKLCILQINLGGSV